MKFQYLQHIHKHNTILPHPQCMFASHSHKINGTVLLECFAERKLLACCHDSARFLRSLHLWIPSIHLDLPSLKEKSKVIKTFEYP
jgi:hypothetical protein